jgi:hypothetical protein
MGGELEPFCVEIEAVPGPWGPEPAAFRLRERTWRVAAVLDRWHGIGYRYVKLRTEDGATAILRHDESEGSWTLTLLDACPKDASAS